MIGTKLGFIALCRRGGIVWREECGRNEYECGRKNPDKKAFLIYLAPSI